MHEEERQRERWARRASRVEAFALSIAGAGAFPRMWKAKVLWPGLGGDAAALGRLAAHGQAPHVTVARSRLPVDLTGLVDELAGYAGPTWTVDQIALVASHLRGCDDRGPRYEPLEQFPLGGRGTYRRG